jgi:hypothetical protein
MSVKLATSQAQEEHAAVMEAKDEKVLGKFAEDRRGQQQDMQHGAVDSREAKAAAEREADAGYSVGLYRKRLNQTFLPMLQAVDAEALIEREARAAAEAQVVFRIAKGKGDKWGMAKALKSFVAALSKQAAALKLKVAYMVVKAAHARSAAAIYHKNEYHKGKWTSSAKQMSYLFDLRAAGAIQQQVGSMRARVAAVSNAIINAKGMISSLSGKGVTSNLGAMASAVKKHNRLGAQGREQEGAEYHHHHYQQQQQQQRQQQHHQQQQRQQSVVGAGASSMTTAMHFRMRLHSEGQLFKPQK